MVFLFSEKNEECISFTTMFIVYLIIFCEGYKKKNVWNTQNTTRAIFCGSIIYYNLLYFTVFIIYYYLYALNLGLQLKRIRCIYFILKHTHYSTGCSIHKRSSSLELIGIAHAISFFFKIVWKYCSNSYNYTF